MFVGVFVSTTMFVIASALAFRTYGYVLRRLTEPRMVAQRAKRSEAWNRSGPIDALISMHFLYLRSRFMLESYMGWPPEWHL